MLDVGSVVRNYKVISEMKPGAQGVVFKVEDEKSHNLYVLKSLFVEEAKRPDFERMIAIWKVLCTSKMKALIVSYVEHFYEGRKTMIVMEYCVGGDLETLIKKRIEKEHEKFTEFEIMKVLIEQMSILNEMHTLNLIHRDIKSANILIGNDGKSKISDFNTSKILEESGGASTMAGTLEYSSAEVVNAEEYSFPADIYSLGVVLYQMIMGKTPFSNARGVVLKDLMAGKYPPINPALGYSHELVDLIHSCLALNPSVRPTPIHVLSSLFVVRAQLALAEARIDKLETALAVAEERIVVGESEAREAKAEIERGILALAAAEREASNTKIGLAVAEGKIAALAAETKEMGVMMRQMRSEMDAIKAEPVVRSFGPSSASASTIISSSSSFSSSSSSPSLTSDTLDLPMVFRPNPKGGCVFTNTSSDIQCKFPSGKRTVFLDMKVSEGVFHWITKIKTNINRDSRHYLGAARSSALDKLNEARLGEDGVGSALKIFSDKRTVLVGLKVNVIGTETKIADNSMVGIEVDASTRTLTFFVNELKIPHGVSNITTPLYLGMSGWDQPAFISVSFRRLTAPTPSAVVCQYHEERV